MQRGGRITEGVGHSNPYLLGVSSSSPVQPSFYPYRIIAPALLLSVFSLFIDYPYITLNY